MLLKNYKYIFFIKIIFLFISLAITFMLSFYTNNDDNNSGNFENNMIFVLDTSHSMNVLDSKGNYGIPISRLDLAKLFIKKQVKDHPNFKYGLIMFAGNANFYLPPTLDKDNFITYLDAVNTGLIPQGGTNIYDGLKTFYNMDSKNNIGILISDMGETSDYVGQKEDLQKLVDQNKNSKNTLYIVGMGTSEGGIVRYPNRDNLQIEGHTVSSKLNDMMGNFLANIFNSKYLVINDYDNLDNFSLFDKNMSINLDENTKLLLQFAGVLFAIMSV